jgi:hypothetical protein
MMPVIKNGRPGTTMVASPLPDADIQAVIAFVHVPSVRKRQRRGARSTSPTIDQLVRGAQAIVIAAAATAKSYR